VAPVGEFFFTSMKFVLETSIQETEERWFKACYWRRESGMEKRVNDLFWSRGEWWVVSVDAKDCSIVWLTRRSWVSC